MGKVDWSKDRPTEVGFYVVRGFHIGHKNDCALVEVKSHKGPRAPKKELVCNIHCINSDRDFDYWTPVDSCSGNFEWAALSAVRPQG